MKINSQLVKGEVKELHPNIFGVSIKNDYDRAMLFCRYQEFYESPFKEIRGKKFSLEKFMWLYKTKNKKPTFTYPEDWAGYNIPSNILWKAYDVFRTDRNEYDEVMSKIIYYCENYPLQFDKRRTKWYLIGADSFKSTTMDHEIAHGLYYTNRKYKSTCDGLISEMKKQDYNKIKGSLIQLGYVDDKKIIDDEIQAFMSTGLHKTFSTGEIKKYTTHFIENFNNYTKK
jgi:hypothetical protein